MVNKLGLRYSPNIPTLGAVQCYAMLGSQRI